MHRFEIEFLSAKLKANGALGIAGAVAALVAVLVIVWLVPGVVG
ncbi:MAG: hypothetical protein AB7I34_22110 [Rhizobiaceae bacterium]